MTGPQVILTTAPGRSDAASIARMLVEERLAACVNLVPRIRSIYRWEGAVTDEAEVLLIVKTQGEQVPALELRVRALHPYALPEFIAVPIVYGSPAWLGWLAASIG